MLNLIYDRTRSDIDTANEIIGKIKDGTATTSEKDMYNTGLKGCYNAVDLTRVSTAVDSLAANLNSAGYSVAAVHQTWTVGQIVTLAQWTQYLANVQALVDTYYTMADTPSVPSAAGKLTYTTANDIEKILADIDTLISWMQHSYRKSGTFQSGNNAARLPLKRSV